MEKNKNQKFKLIHRRPLKLEKVPPHDQVFSYLRITSVDTEMCCPKGKCGCQYFILLT
jgi:xanthine dehydrogenase iron-sulfur cluster and FAD-binding subunit A